jgi:hypothetical protein
MRLCPLLVLAVGLLLPGFVHAAPPKGTTLEQLLCSPFPTALVAAPVGGKVAWVANDCGRRNIWVAEAPHYKARSLTTYRRQ